MEDSNESYEIIETEEIVEVEEVKRVDHDKTNTLDTNETGMIKVDNHESMNMTREQIAKFKPMPLPAINLIGNANGRSTNLVEETDPVTGKKIERMIQTTTNVDVMNVNQSTLNRPTLAPFKPIDLDKLKSGAIDIQTTANHNNNTQVKDTVIKKPMPAINLDAFKMGNYKNLADKNIDLENTKGEKIEEIITKEISKDPELEKIAKLEEQERLRRLKQQEDEKELERQREMERQRDLKRRKEQELEEEMERQREREHRETQQREEQIKRLRELEIEAEQARLKQIEEQDRLRRHQDEDRERDHQRKLRELEEEKRRQQKEDEERERQKRREQEEERRRSEEERRRREEERRRREEERRRSEEERQRREEKSRRMREEEEARLARERALAKANELKDYKADDSLSRSQMVSHEKFIVNNVKDDLFNGDKSFHSYSEKSMTNEQRDEMLKNVLGVVAVILTVIFIFAMLKAFIFTPLVPVPIPVPVSAVAGGAFPAGLYATMRTIGTGGFGPAGIVLSSPPVIVATVAAPGVMAGAPATGKSLGVQTNTVGNNGNPSTFTDTDNSLNSNIGTLVKQNSQQTHTIEHKNNVNIIQAGHPHSPHGGHGPTIINNYNQPVKHSHYIKIYAHDDKSATLMAHSVNSADMSNQNTSVASQSQSTASTVAPVAIATSNVEAAQPVAAETPIKKEEGKNQAETLKTEPKIVINESKEQPNIVVNVPKQDQNITVNVPKQEPHITVNIPKEEPKITLNLPKEEHQAAPTIIREESKPIHLNVNINLDQKLAAPQNISVQKEIDPKETNIDIPIKIEQEAVPKTEPIIPLAKKEITVIEDTKQPEPDLIQSKSQVKDKAQPNQNKIANNNSIHESIVDKSTEKVEEPIKESEEKVIVPPEEPKQEIVVITNSPPVETEKKEQEVQTETEEEEVKTPVVPSVAETKNLDDDIESDKLLKELNEKYDLLERSEKESSKEKSDVVIEEKLKTTEQDEKPEVVINRIVAPPTEQTEKPKPCEESDNVKNVYHFNDFDTEHHDILPTSVDIIDQPNSKTENEDATGGAGLTTTLAVQHEASLSHSEGVVGAIVQSEDHPSIINGNQSTIGIGIGAEQAFQHLNDSGFIEVHQIASPSDEGQPKVTKTSGAHLNIAAQSNEQLTAQVVGASHEPGLISVPITIEGAVTPCEEIQAKNLELQNGLI
jgi:hypothetical protein